MHALERISQSVPSENWDDDFEFQQTNTNERSMTNEKHATASLCNATSDASRTSTSSRFSEDWDIDHEVQKPQRKYAGSILEDKMNYFPSTHLPDPRPQPLGWSDSGPSTPTKRPKSSQTEIWDDYYEDKTDSPIRKIPSRSPESTPRQQKPPSQVRRYRQPSSEESERWDAESYANRKQNDNNASPSRRNRQDTYLESSDEAELQFVDKEDDHTVTARLRPRTTLFNGLVSSPPVHIPTPSSTASVTETFPRSPSDSVFSISLSTATGYDSGHHCSTSRLALRPTMSDASSALAILPSAPFRRERRRLRKKSRPPHVDENVFELQDRGQPQLSSSLPQRPSTPDCNDTPPPTSDPLPEVTASNKAPLLSRIGSVKKWGIRRKRASTPPSDVPQDSENESNTRPPSSLAQSSSGGNWFFRAAGGRSRSSSPEADVTHGATADCLNVSRPSYDHSDHSISDTAENPPATKLNKRKSLGFVHLRQREPQLESKDASHGQMPVLSAPCRPTSMQPKPRHASYAYGVSTVISTSTSVATSVSPVAVSSSVEDLDESGPREGSRGFMGGVRRISIIGGQKKHKRTKSSDPASDLPDILPTVPTPSPLATLPLEESRLSGPDDHSQPCRQTSTLVVSQSAPVMQSYGNESSVLPELNALNSSHRFSSVMIGGSSIISTKTPTSPQSASLGRSISPTVAATAAVLRRNSLGDLKIPSRISQAQMGLKRDLSMVREFAVRVEQLKELQATYASLASDVQMLLESRQSSRATLPAFFHRPLPGSRPRSNTSPLPSQKPSKHLTTMFEAINSKYRISWECAELLIELGGGHSSSETPPPTSVSAPAMHSRRGSMDSTRKKRGRAITLTGEGSKPPILLTSSFSTPRDLSWRASTGRHDLTQRQLVLLREILDKSEPTFPGELPIPEEFPLNREWRWGEPTSSTVTLLSEESQGTSSNNNRRSGVLGMRGLRDMLRSLKRNHTEPSVSAFTHPPSVKDSSVDHASHHRYNHPHIPTRRGAKTSTGVESVTSEQSPTSPCSEALLKQKSSPRRPSLASIFRLGQKSKGSGTPTSGSSDQWIESTHSTTTQSSTQDSNSNGNSDEEAWNRIDSTSDLDSRGAIAKGDVRSGGGATVRGKLTYSQGEDRASVLQRNPSVSRSSIAGEGSSHTPPTRFTRLSNVEENVDVDGRSTKGKNRSCSQPHVHPPSRSLLSRTGSTSGNSVRSTPQPSLMSASHSKAAKVALDTALLTETKLAMTPENIRPLLENAREVLARLQSCNGEIRSLLAAS